MTVCSADSLVADALELAAQIAEHPLPSLMATKRLMIVADDEDIRHARELEGQAFAHLLRLPNAPIASRHNSTSSPDHERARPRSSRHVLGARRAARCRTPDVVMFEDEDGRSMTFGEYQRDAEGVAAALFERGVTSGSVVSWQVPTTIEAAVLMAALARLDAVQNPIIPIMRGA